MRHQIAFPNAYKEDKSKTHQADLKHETNPFRDAASDVAPCTGEIAAVYLKPISLHRHIKASMTNKVMKNAHCLNKRYG